MSKIAKYLSHFLTRMVNYGKFKGDFLRTLPAAYHPAAQLLFYYNQKAAEKKLAQKIEAFRASIPELAKGMEVGGYTSPHSGTFQKDEKGHAVSGTFLQSGIEAHMKTGTAIFKGILLRRIVEGTKVQKILELGTNTGFSGSYFLSVDGVELTTVEGSEAFCKIAKFNMDRISKKHRIIHAFFDDAIDQLIQEGESFDCVFIDGQHEREATLHYANRVKPLMKRDAYYIFDDIYWSEDMNQAWKELCFSYNFCEAVDLLNVGLCKQGSDCKKTVLYDIGDYIPRPAFQRKNW